MTKTFSAIDMDGNLILKSRGKVGAAQKVLDALYAYRDGIRTGSGYLYGQPMSLGHVEVDGVRYEGDHFYQGDMLA